MSFLTRLLRPRIDSQAALRPLWHQIVAVGRDPVWYRDLGVADSLTGRFDVIILVLCLVLMRLEKEPDLIAPSALLTELFVADMDGQLRESGIGDLVVGKHIGRLMGVLGGRLGAYREALAEYGDAALVLALTRNVTLLEGHNADDMAKVARAFSAKLMLQDGGEVLAGEIAL